MFYPYPPDYLYYDSLDSIYLLYYYTVYYTLRSWRNLGLKLGETWLAAAHGARFSIFPFRLSSFRWRLYCLYRFAPTVFPISPVVPFNAPKGFAEALIVLAQHSAL